MINQQWSRIKDDVMCRVYAWEDLLEPPQSASMQDLIEAEKRIMDVRRAWDLVCSELDKVNQ